MTLQYTDECYIIILGTPAFKKPNSGPQPNAFPLLLCCFRIVIAKIQGLGFVYMVGLSCMGFFVYRRSFGCIQKVDMREFGDYCRRKCLVITVKENASNNLTYMYPNYMGSTVQGTIV